MYHPSYKGPTAIDIAQGQRLDYDSIFYPPENEEWIIPHSSRQQTEPILERRNKKKLQAPVENKQVDMRPYNEAEEGAIPSTDEEQQPPSNNKWGSLQTRKPKDLSQWQQGYMSRQEVSGEATTSVASAQSIHSSITNPHYKIPKKLNLESNRLNQLVSNISPPAKERKEGTDQQSYQPHKQKKGRSLGQISGTRQRGGRSKK